MKSSTVPKLLTKRELASWSKKNPQWTLNKKATELKRVIEMPDYVTGLVFIARVAVHAEIQNHHPDMTLSHGQVSIKTTTHDSKGLTKKDITMAGKIDKLNT